MDLDDVLGYSTKKIVFIRDRQLGVLYYVLVFCIVLYVFGVQMFWHNEQFSLRDVKGFERMKLSHPTVNACDASDWDCKSDFRSLEQLPYCTVYTGAEDNLMKGPCKFEDIHSVLPNGEVDNKMFIPTSVEIMTEKRVCQPGPENGYHCVNEYEEVPGEDCSKGKYMCTKRAGKEDQFYYVADTKNFHIQFTSSYEQGEVHGTSLDHPAYVEVCPSKLRDGKTVHKWTDRLEHSEKHACEAHEIAMEKMECMEGVDCSQKGKFDLLKHTGAGKVIKPVDLPKDMKVPEVAPAFPADHPAKDKTFLEESSRVFTRGLRAHPVGLAAARDGSHDAGGEENRTSISSGGHRGPEDQDQFTSFWGDHFKLKRLFELAGADLDRDFNFDGYSTRQSGTVLEVSAVYSNLYAFYSTLGYKDVNYYYKVRELPLPYMSRSQLTQTQPADYPETRTYEIRHGVLIWFKVSGEFGVFKTSYLLLVLVTGFALISSASTITDIVAIYIHPRKNNYFNLKYQISPDFSDMWICEKCSYRNSVAHTTCRGYEMWQSEVDCKPCGMPRPDVATRS